MHYTGSAGLINHGNRDHTLGMKRSGNSRKILVNIFGQSPGWLKFKHPDKYASELSKAEDEMQKSRYETEEFRRKLRGRNFDQPPAHN